MRNLFIGNKFKWNRHEARKLAIRNNPLIWVPCNICLREYLLANQHEIPKEWEKHNVVFRDTLFFDDQGCRAWPGMFFNTSQKKWVPYLYQEITKDQKVARTYNNSDLRAVHREMMKRAEGDRRVPLSCKKNKPRMIRRPKDVK